MAINGLSLSLSNIISCLETRMRMRCTDASEKLAMRMGKICLEATFPIFSRFHTFLLLGFIMSRTKFPCRLPFLKMIFLEGERKHLSKKDENCQKGLRISCFSRCLLSFFSFLGRLSWKILTESQEKKELSSFDIQDLSLPEC